LYDDDLLFGDPSEVAAFLGVTLRTLRRYKAKPDSIPEGYKRLLRLRLEGDLRAIGGDAWEGFYIGRDGLLFSPLFERGLHPRVVSGMFFTMQEVVALRSEVRDLRGRLEALRSGVEYLRRGGQVAALQSLGDLAPLQVSHQRQSSRST
jgi:hypothetical protein